MEYRKDTAELGNCWHFAEQLGGMDVGPNDPMSENFKKTLNATEKKSKRSSRP